MLILVLCIFIFQGTLGDLIVQLPNGKVQGTTFDTPSGKSFYTWRGIPYAKPPIGELRYLPPVKAEPWEGILDASKDSPACILFSPYPSDPTPLNGASEDCLYINVYSPNAVGSNSRINSTLAVLVWIYGGGYLSGFSDFGFYDPTAFLEENIIFVSFNYRLGPLGFLSTEDDVIPGNAGLRDQNLAFQWVQENIAFFGGSAQDVTIFGESAGAMSVGYHIASPMSRNLFKGAIMESGCGVGNMIQSGARNFAISLANQIDSSITNSSKSEEIRKVLQGVPAEVLITLDNGTMVGAVIEGKSNQSFLTGPLYETIESGDIAQVPVIIGFNSEEIISIARDLDYLKMLASMYDSNVNLLIPHIWNLKENVSTETVGEEIHRQYVGKGGLFADNLGRFVEFQSDNTFTRSSTKHAILQSKFSPVYMYQFSFVGTISKHNPDVPGAGRVAHAEEVPYLFNVSTKPLETEADFLTRKRFVKLWTNFAKTSNPTPDDDSAELLQNVKWYPITAANVTYLDIDTDLQFKPSRKVGETILWDYVWSTLAERPYITF